MAVDEVPNHPVQVRLRRKLEELVGVEEADLLMDRPPGGWSSLVTKDWLDERLTHERELTDERFRSLDERFRSLEGRFDERFRSLEGRSTSDSGASRPHGRSLGRIDDGSGVWRIVSTSGSAGSTISSRLRT